MRQEIIGKLFVSGVFGVPGISNDIVDFMFDVLEFDSKAFIEFFVSIVGILGSDDFNELFEIVFNILVICEQNKYLLEVLCGLSERTADNVELADVLLFDEIIELGDDI